MPLLTGTWSLVANGHKGELLISSVSATGVISFDMAALEPFREVLILDQRLGPRRRSMRRIMARRTNTAALRA